MELKKLLPVLKGAYERDQIRLNTIQRQIDALTIERDAMCIRTETPQGDRTDIQGLLDLEKHHIWQRQTVLRLEVEIEALRPEADKAKSALKKTFGKLEVVKSLVSTKTRF